MSDSFDASQDIFEDPAETDNLKDCQSTNKVSWKGVPLEALKSSCEIYPPIHPSREHTVTFKLPYQDSKPVEPYPEKFTDKWDDNHVHLPHSPKNIYFVSEGVRRSRWEKIKSVLSQNIRNSNDLQAAILKYSPQFAQKWNFEALHEFFSSTLEEGEAGYFFETVLPGVVSLALEAENLIRGPIPLLKRGSSRSLSMSQRQIASLLANAFLCTFPRRNTPANSFPTINFDRLFLCGGLARVQEKLKCFVNYFRRVCFSSCCDGVVTYSRHHVPVSRLPKWCSSSRVLPLFHISSEGTIEDEGAGLLEIDFANRYIGGGILGRGSVQEEIKFAIYPELVLARLFTESLEDNEAVIISGCERFNNYAGYGNTFTWAGNCTDEVGRDTFGRKTTTSVAIDATRFGNPLKQFTQPVITRELNKAYCGFSFGTRAGCKRGIATGNWGCGAFRGDPHLKALIQLMAAAESDRPLAYFTFSDDNLRNSVFEMYTFLTESNITVGSLYNALSKFEEYVTKSYSHKSRHDIKQLKANTGKYLYEYLYQYFKNESGELSGCGSAEDSSMFTDDELFEQVAQLDQKVEAEASSESRSRALEPLPAETYSMSTEEGRQLCLETERHRWEACLAAKQTLTPQPSPSQPIKRKISDYFTKTPSKT